MINKKLISLNAENNIYIVFHVFFKWISLLCNMSIMVSIVYIIKSTYLHVENKFSFYMLLCVIMIRFLCDRMASKMSYLSSCMIKRKIRKSIYQKLLSIGIGARYEMNTSQIIQLSTEGVDQLDVYFSSYLPQLFYSILAPITLFLFISQYDFLSAFILFILVPLIPISIIIVQKIAKNLLSKYWTQYTVLGDSFLENLQGLNTLKIYQADEQKNQKMNQEAEYFRKITMKVLIMQLNSISIMDLVAYGGASLGIILSCTQTMHGKIDFFDCLLLILLVADFFIPMRTLGSFFHVAMNGMAASEKIWDLLNIKEREVGKQKLIFDSKIHFEDVSFHYDDKRVLNSISMDIEKNKMTAIVGESGCGKSTLVSFLSGINQVQKGSIFFDQMDLSKIDPSDLVSNITYIGSSSYLFKGTIKENLRMANPSVDEKKMIEVLKRVKLYDFLFEQKGLDTFLLEQASNLSKGQKQRLALARALIKESSIYIFDEATSNIDCESEQIIIDEIVRLSKKACVIVISHRLANIKNADRIYVMKEGCILEQGNHESLLKEKGVYELLWNTQASLEKLTKEVQYEKI